MKLRVKMNKTFNIFCCKSYKGGSNDDKCSATETNKMLSCYKKYSRKKREALCCEHDGGIWGLSLQTSADLSPHVDTVDSEHSVNYFCLSRLWWSGTGGCLLGGSASSRCWVSSSASSPSWSRVSSATEVSPYSWADLWSVASCRASAKCRQQIWTQSREDEALLRTHTQVQMCGVDLRYNGRAEALTLRHSDKYKRSQNGTESKGFSQCEEASLYSVFNWLL